MFGLLLFMALGDGVRRNVATIDLGERNLLRDAILELQQRRYPGGRDDVLPGGVSFWFKQDEIHQATHVHGGYAFLTWHRELVNRFEYLLREVNPQLSLHYWDWNTDPRGPLFTPAFMGGHNGDAGEPWLSGGFYIPGATPYRDDDAFNGANDHPFDPPRTLTRNVAAINAKADGTPNLPHPDSDIINAATYTQMADLLENSHNRVHNYIGGTIQNGHTSFRDPFVFLLHSNVDRLFAMWQTVAGQEWRLNPATVYGSSVPSAINEPLEPWAVITPAASTGRFTRPWAPPENRRLVKTSRDPSVVAPPCYDTLATVPGTVLLGTAALTFNDVPVAEKTVRAVDFTVYACGDVTLRVTDGPRQTSGPASVFELPLGGTVVVPRRAGYTVPHGRIWVAFTGTSPGDHAEGTIQITCDQTGDVFNVPISTDTIARPRAAVTLVLDRSNSMSFDGGDGRTRLQVLKDSATPFVDKLQENNAVGMVAFDHDPHDVLPITVVGAPDDATDPNRDAARTAITNHTHNPAGWTAIGDGVERADALLAPVSSADFAVKAMIVLTDGQETADKRIAAVTPIIAPNLHIYAIGLGTPEEIQPAALSALAHGNRGTLQMTGLMSQDDRYALTKFYLQILANVTNEDIVTDPVGYILPGQEHRIPFDLCEADISTDVLLLHPAPGVIDFSVETPGGQILTTAAAGVGAKHVVGQQITYFRLPLPLLANNLPSHEGRWTAVLRVDKRVFRKYLSSLDNQPDEMRRVAAHGLQYSMSAHAYSNLRLKGELIQSSFEPRASMTVRAVLQEYGLMKEAAGVSAELLRPDGTTVVLAMPPVEPGIFETLVPAPIPGIYRFHIRAVGSTLRGTPFTREQLLTGAVWRGGDRPASGHPNEGEGGGKICDFLSCLSQREDIVKFLRERGLDTEGLLKCLDGYCAPSTPPR